MSMFDPCPICHKSLDGRYRVAGIRGSDGKCIYVHYDGCKDPGACWERRGELATTHVTVIGATLSCDQFRVANR